MNHDMNGNGNGNDMNLHSNSGQPDEFEAGGNSPPVDVNDFLRMELPLQESYWGDRLLDAQSRLIICGQGKIGKTFFALNLAVALSKGKEFLGFKVPRSIRVLYIQKEISQQMLQDRIRKVTANLIQSCPPKSLLIQTVRDFNLDNKQHQAYLDSWIESCQPEVVIFDPLYQFHNGEENSQKEMKALLDIFDKVIQKHKVSVVLIHHTRKPNFRDWFGNHLMRGSVVFRDWVDTVMMLGQKKNQKTIDVDWTVRNAEKPNPMTIMMDDQCQFKVTKTNEPTRRNIHDKLKKFMLTLDGEKGWIRQSLIISEAKAKRKWGSGSVRRWLEEGKKMGIFNEKKKPGRRDWIVYKFSNTSAK